MTEAKEQTSPATPAPSEFDLPEDALIIIPMRGTVLFPSVILPLSIGRRRSIAAAQEAVKAELPIGIIQQRDSSVDMPTKDDLHTVGTQASILRYVTDPADGHHTVCQGHKRFRVIEFLEGYPFFVARVEYIESEEKVTPEMEAHLEHLRRQVREAIELMPQIPSDIAVAIESIESAGTFADTIAHFVDMTPAEKQQILETLDVAKRIEMVTERLAHRLAIMRLTGEIEKQTKEAVDNRQREYILREQMKTIQKELGEVGAGGDDIQELRNAIDESGMSTEAKEQAERELSRLERMSDESTEYSMVRNYLDWLIDLPWQKLSEAPVDIKQARSILDEDHYGLEKVKRRILEHLAVRKLNPEGKSPILCLVGPPGVGKTSLGKSIARAMGREFVRIALGGLHDESEIRGHRRTYIGAMPGKIIQAIRRADTRNPVFMLDEMDKLGSGFHGDPSAALLEVLDPEQNATFKDNYLGVDFDLSRVMFIATANMLDPIPGPLRDRMEVIELAGYTQDEKLEIAKRYLISRQLEASGLKSDQATISDAALHQIISGYTRESGCRNLEREIGSVFRYIAMRVAEGSTQSMQVDLDNLPDILGAQKFESEVAMRVSMPGVVTGLAWTPVGGDILFIEAARIPGQGKLILTGQLGDVMKESAQASLSLVKAKAETLGVDIQLFEKNDIHVHVPAGAIPKDGPSAGVAMFTALVSLLTGKTVRQDTAMTGEISLRGLVLPVGGIKEKCVAAARAGITTVLLPERNRRDLEEIPQAAQDQLKFIWLSKVDDVLDVAFTGSDL